MKKTDWTMIICASVERSATRRVWTDGNDYFVKVEGELRNVTRQFAEKNQLFIHD